MTWAVLSSNNFESNKAWDQDKCKTSKKVVLRLDSSTTSLWESLKKIGVNSTWHTSASQIHCVMQGFCSVIRSGLSTDTYGQTLECVLLHCEWIGFTFAGRGRGRRGAHLWSRKVDERRRRIQTRTKRRHRSTGLRSACSLPRERRGKKQNNELIHWQSCVDRIKSNKPLSPLQNRGGI